MSHVYQGAVAPEAYELNLVPGTSGIDLSTVSAGSLKVMRADGVEATWSTALSNKTTNTLTLTHAFGASDVDFVGDYAIYAVLTVPGGTVRSVPLKLSVQSRYSTRFSP